MVAEEPHPRRAVRAGQDLDAPARKADAGAVEALDHGLLGRPAPGQPFGVGACVGELGGGVDLVQEAAAGPLDREGDPVHRYRINPDSLHDFSMRGTRARLPLIGALNGRSQPSYSDRERGRIRAPALPPGMGFFELSLPAALSIFRLVV